MSNKSTSVLSLATMFGGKDQLGTSDAAVSKVAEIANQVLTAEGKNLVNAYKVIQIPSNSTGSFGAVAIVNVVNATGAAPVAYYHLLMVEAARGTPLEKLTSTINGTVIELEVTVGDAYTADYRNIVRNYLSNNGVKGATYRSAGYQIVYRECDLESAAKFAPIMAECTRAIASVESRNDLNAEVFSLSSLKDEESRIRLVTQLFVDERVTEPNGMPVRADLTAKLALSGVSDPKNPTSTSSVVPICETSAYVDLIYTRQAAAFGAYQPQSNGPLFIPRVTISNSALRMPVSALEFALLNIGAMVTLLSNGTYGLVWRPTFGEEDNLRDIGAVGYLAPYMHVDKVPGMLKIQDQMELQGLLNYIMNKNIIYSMDLRQGGAGNWCNDIFLRAAGTGAKADEARQRIITAANNLTDGKFSTFFTGNGPVVSPNVEIFPSGYYSQNGEQQDISKIDLLAVLNLFGGKDINFVWGFLSVVYDTNTDANLRMYRRIRMLNTFSKALTIKSYGSKINFTGEFISALTRAIAATEVNFVGSSLGSNNEPSYNQTTDMWASAMVDPSTVGSLYNRNTNTGNGQSFVVGNNASYF